MTRAGIALLVAGVAGCSANRLEGLIADQRVFVESTWVTYEPGFYGEDGRLIVTLTSLPSACNAVAFWIGQRMDSQDTTAWADAWEVSFPREWWAVELEARTPGDTWPVENLDWPGLAWEASLEEPVRLKGHFFHFHDHPTPEAFDVLPESDPDFLTRYTSDVGVVRWQRSVRDVVLSGRFNTFVVDEQGADAGRVEAHFRAFPCPSAAGGLF